MEWKEYEEHLNLADLRKENHTQDTIKGFIVTVDSIWLVIFWKSEMHVQWPVLHN